MEKKLLIIDLSNFIFRAYYGVGPLSSKDNHPTGAIFGVANMIINMVQSINPTHILIAVDSNSRKERKNLYEDYKSNRNEIPEELKMQIPIINEMLKIMNFCCVEYEGYEADDVIGTACKNNNVFDFIYIASGDKDLMQLVNENVFVYDSMKNKIYNEKGVIEKFGIKPSQIVDYLALIGDKSDNIPGVKGIGPKSAISLLTEYNDLENIYLSLNNIKSKSTKEKLENEKSIANLSKELATIKTDLKIELPESSLIHKLTLNEELNNFLLKYDLNFIINKIKSLE